MSNIAISAENLSKSYLIGHNSGRAEPYTALRDVLARNTRDLARRTRDMLLGRAIIQGDEVEEFWALKDVSFEIKQGDRVGIIGPNGAGKSTLLKILSRITEPTKGRIQIIGRVASLLEVGTGFHPELTGSENIFLNGAILGMSRREIRRKFDEIVSFAEVGQFLDTPVKRYSSGMYVRLAFAVAAHLEPEILVVDEVLAVGDFQFQKKCLGKMEEVGKTGRTVLFVSHNMAAINLLCSKVLRLSAGRLISVGDPHVEISAYLNQRQESASANFPKRCGDGLLIEHFRFVEDVVQSGNGANLLVSIRALKQETISDLALLIYTQTGIRIAVLDLRNTQGSFSLKSDGKLELNINITSLWLVEGQYSFGLWILCNSFKGDLVDLNTLNVLSANRDFVTRPADVRGFMELDYCVESSIQ